MSIQFSPEAMAGIQAATIPGKAAQTAPKSEPKAEPKVEARPEPRKESPSLREPEPEADASEVMESEAKEIQKEIQREIWRLKADGEEFEWDPSDVEATKRAIMKARGADKRFDSAAKMRKEAEEFFAMLRDPKNADRFRKDPNIGQSFMEVAKRAILNQMDEEALTPEQREQRAKDEELEALRRERDSIKEKETQTARQQRVDQHLQTYEQRLIKVLESGGVPADNHTVARMAEYLLLNVDQGIDLAPEDLVGLIQEEHGGIGLSYMDKMDPDRLVQYLGPERMKKIREYEMRQLKSPHANPFPARERPKAQKEQQTKRLQGKEWKDDVIGGFSEFMRTLR